MYATRPRLALVAAAIVVAAGVRVCRARDVNDAELQFQLGTLLFEETRYREALEAFRKAVGADDPRPSPLQARIGVVKSALRLGEFIEAQHEATTLQAAGAAQRRRASRCTPTRCGRPGCSTRPHQEFSDALGARARSVARPSRPGARAGVAEQARRGAERSAGSRSSSSPRDGEIHHTVGAIFERMRRYEQAAAAYGNYVNLLPNKDRSDKAAWSRSQIRFLRRSASASRSRSTTTPRDSLHTVDFRSSTTR